MKTNALVAAVLLAGYAFGPPLDAAALTLTRGPYLQLGTQSSIVVRWRTETATDSRVRYGTNPSNLSSVVDDSTSATEHVVKLTGLNPSTKYYYSVGHSEATLAGGTDHFFVAAPTPGTEQPTLIWVLGNSGTAIAKARAVRDAYFKYKGNQYTHLWLMLGDKAYHNRTDSDYQDALFNTYPTLLRQTTLWPALGHRDDGVTADSASQSGAYYDIFTLPKQGEAGGLASGTEAYYSFDYSNIHFVVLDSVESSKAPSGAMLTWLENDLAVTTQPWIIAYWDHPPCSKGFHDPDTEIALREMRENVLPILGDASVDLVLNGDCGSYERSFLIDGHSGSSVTFEPQTMLVDGSDGSIDGDGEYQTSVIDRPIRDAVVGSSGETQVGSLDYPVIYVSLKILGSMALNVNGPLLDAVFLDDTGQVRDPFRMVKTTDTAKASTSAPDVPTTEVNPTPQTVTVSPTGGTVRDAAWTSSTDNVGVTGYKVYRGGAQMTTVSGTSYQNTGASPSTTYTYTVAGYDAAGNTSAQASSASATTQAATLCITSYGATGNDTTDDTTAIKNTIRAAQSQRKGVYVPPGTFRYTSFRFNGIALTGNGPKSILYAPNQASSMIILNGNGPVLKNLKVRTNGTSRTGADHNIFVEAATNFTIDNVEVTGSASAAILTYGSSGPGKIINNYVHDTFSDGIHNTGGAHDIIVANNRVRNTGDDMIATVSYSTTTIVRNILVQDNDVAGNDWGRGITSVGSADITIQGNKIGRTGCCAGILVATEPSYTSPPLSNVLIRNNTLSNNSGSTGHGAFLISAFNGNIDRVRFEGNTSPIPCMRRSSLKEQTATRPLSTTR